MDIDVPAHLLERLATLTNLPLDAVRNLLLVPKEQSVGVKALRWLSKQTGLTGLNKKMETAADVAVTAAILPSLQTLLQHLCKKENLCQEGLFRKSGSTSRQRNLKRRLLNGEGLDASACTVHDCATVLKAMMADMPEPLLTRRLYNAYIFVHGMRIKERKVEATKILMSFLPATSYSVVRDLLRLLHDVALHEATTKMTSSGLATVFAPHLMCSRLMSPSELLTASRDIQPCVTFMIEHAHTIFKVEDAMDCSSVLGKGRPHYKSTVELNASSRCHLGGTKRRHSDHGGPSEYISDSSLAGVTPMKCKNEDGIGSCSSYEIIPIVRLVRQHGGMLEASPFARRDGTRLAQPAHSTLTSTVASSRRRTSSPGALKQLSPVSPGRKPLLGVNRATPAATSLQSNCKSSVAAHSRPPPRPQPRRSLVTATPQPAPRKRVRTASRPNV